MLAALIGAGLALGGSFLSSKSSKKAASKAADTSLQVAQTNNALARDIYGQNQQALAPFMQRGNAAGDTLNAFLGLGAQQPQVQSYYSGANPEAAPIGMTWEQAMGGEAPHLSPNALSGRFMNGTLGQSGSTPGFNPNAPTPSTAPPNPMDAFRNYIANSDYGFQFGEGANRVNSGYAGNGVLRSGAGMKALERFRQDLQSGYRGEYTNLLANQQNVGLSGANALAGVGTNYVGTVSANNQNAGDAAANAALVRGANNPLANALSLLGGGLFRYGTG